MTSTTEDRNQTRRAAEFIPQDPESFNRWASAVREQMLAALERREGKQ